MEDQRLVQAKEDLLCRIILDYAKEFYKDPENLRAYEEWRKERESFFK